MTQADKDKIIAEFVAALTGRYGPILPAQAVKRHADVIARLRADHLPWAQIEELFNAALKQHGKPALAAGSVARLYAVHRLRTKNKPGSEASDTSPMAGGNAPIATIGSQPADQALHISAGAAAVPVLSLSPGNETESVVPPAGPVQPSNQFARVHQRRANRQRMDEHD